MRQDRATSPGHGPLSRRALLRASGLTLGSLTLGALGTGGLISSGLSLSQLLAAEGQPGSASAPCDAAIFLMLNGGPSHLDMWDMKPDAPIEIRGEFQPIATSLPGVQFSEHLPRMAKEMHRCTLIRSMHHSVNNAHAAAVYAALTGHDRGEMGGGAKPTDHPPVGSVLSKLRPGSTSAIPYVCLPYKTKEGAGGPLQPGFLAGFLGASSDPFWVVDDPNAANFRVPNLSLVEGVSAGQFAARGELLQKLGRSLEKNSAESSLTAIDRFRHQAMDLLTSSHAAQAFQLEKEPENVRDTYGRNIYGQSVLLARRLIEAGTRVVTVSWAPDANATWDTHGQNFTKLKGTLLPQFDLACSALIGDLAQSGRLSRTLVAVVGDFGRSPKINNGAGRDHWNACYTVLLAGGGIKPGFVLGSSDRHGSQPASRPVTPGDLIATIYRLLGIDPRTVIYDSLERPHTVVPVGNVVREVMA